MESLLNNVFETTRYFSHLSLQRQLTKTEILTYDALCAVVEKHCRMVSMQFDISLDAARAKVDSELAEIEGKINAAEPDSDSDMGETSKSA